MDILDKKDLNDIMIGSMYLGTGGGGSLSIAQNNLKSALSEGLEFRLMDVSEMGDDEYAAVPYDVGSLTPTTAPGTGDNPSSGGEENTQTVAAFRALADYMKENFTAVITGEIGPESTAASLIVAARLGLVALDADGVGRAAPEISQYSVLLAGISTIPAGCVTPSGDEFILTKISKTGHEEEIVRSVAAASGYVSVADAPMPGRIAKKKGVLVTGSISKCRKIGAAFHDAKDRNQDPIEAALKVADGFRLFDGTVETIESHDENGFTVGEIRINGNSHDDGRHCIVRFQNENLVARIDGQIVATVPDLVSIVDRDSGIPVGNPNFSKGQSVVVVGFPADPIWTTAKGLKVFGPRHFGIEQDYVGISKLYRRFLKGQK